MLTHLHTFPQCSPRPQMQLGSGQRRKMDQRLPSSPVDLLFFSPFFYTSTLSIPLHMVWFPWKQRLCKKKKTVPRVSELFFFLQFLSLFCSCFLSLSLPPSFAESQAVCGAINIINQHNSTALSSAGRDEEARGNVNMPAWSSLNQ